MKTILFFLICLLNLQNAFAYSEKEIQTILNQNETIKKLDLDLNIVYLLLKNFSTPKEQDALLKDQRNWIQERNKAISEVGLEGLYGERINSLKDEIRKKEEPHLSQVLIGEPEIDTAKATDALKNCPTLACQSYSVYLNAQDIDHEAERIKFIKEKLLDVLAQLDSTYKGKTVDQVFGDDPVSALVEYTGYILPGDKECMNGIKVPLWLYIKEKGIQDYDTGTCFNPYGVELIASDDIENLPTFDLFNKTLIEVDVGHWHQGTTYRGIFSNLHRTKDYLAFVPDRLEIDKINVVQGIQNESLKRWAFKGPWNYKKFADLKEAFNKMADELQGYYESYEYLDKYAPYTMNYLNKYVDHHHEGPIEMASEPAYEIFKEPDMPLSDLKQKINGFSKEDWNAALSYAILNGYGTDVLEWIMVSGADVNAKVDGEPILIKATNRPDILKYLLTKGAKIEGQTSFGKTALFYAIQFNNLDSIKALVEAGANVNASLEKDKENLDDEEYWDLEEVLGFNPLAYSMRYGSEDVTKYLVSKGAHLKPISEKKLEAWVNKSEDDDRFKKHMALVK